MKTTEPKLDQRPEQPYAGIRAVVPMQEMPNFIPQSIGEVAGYLAQQGVEPAGAPIIRYHVCPTAASPAAECEISVGFPVARPVKGSDRIIADALPAGRYASLVFTGVENGVPGNGVLVDWAKAQGIEWDSHDVATGEAFNGRVEYLIDGPDDDPNPSNWKTEVAIKLADK
jgi:effector-binding domain-containing protein